MCYNSFWLLSKLGLYYNLVVDRPNGIMMHTYTHRLPRRTAQQVSARRPGITTGFSTGKKLPHAVLSGCSQEAYNPGGIHQMEPPEHTSDKQAYYSTPEG